MVRGAENVAVHAYASDLEGVPVYLLDAGPIGNAGSVYSSEAELDGEKYTLFSLAALELARQIDWEPHVVHANDWHSALACYAILLRRRASPGTGPATVLTVHNLPFLGPDIRGALHEYGLSRVKTGLPTWATGRPLALGLWAADAIVGVSPSYARDMQTPESGAGLHEYVRARRDSVYGILNGIDIESYNPAADTAIASNFGLPSLERRILNKAALQVRVGLPADSAALLIGVVSRMDPQKGMDLVPPAVRRLVGLNWQIVILGTGLPRMERAMQRLALEMPTQVRAEIRYDGALARQIYAGADVLLMPSRYEPCGLAQMIAMRYGCLPVVTPVGGLKDTVEDGMTGFVAKRPTAAELASTLRRASGLLPEGSRWGDMQRLAMSQDFSWGASARQYYDLYKRVGAEVVPVQGTLRN
jgi:starch synthase